MSKALVDLGIEEYQFRPYSEGVEQLSGLANTGHLTASWRKGGDKHQKPLGFILILALPR